VRRTLILYNAISNNTLYRIATHDRQSNTTGSRHLQRIIIVLLLLFIMDPGLDARTGALCVIEQYNALLYVKCA